MRQSTKLLALVALMLSGCITKVKPPTREDAAAQPTRDARAAGDAGDAGGAVETDAGVLPRSCREDNGGCDPLVACFIVQGAPRCAPCPTGYDNVNGDGTECKDLDECELGTDECADETTCTNTEGSFSCDCPEGYALNRRGTHCENINECSLGLYDCDTDPEALCEDTEGSFSCLCPEGFDSDDDGRTCFDLDECELGLDNCDNDGPAVCSNLYGGFSCTCPDDYRDLNRDGTDCEKRCDPLTEECRGDVALGLGHTCAALNNGKVKCWGANAAGQCGQGDRTLHGESPDDTPELLPAVSLGAQATAVAAGCAHSCALLEGGAVKCWGSNEFGQLGLGDTDNRGDDADEMGDNLPAVELGADAIAISAGCEFTCALLEGGDVKCWGANNWGQLGQDDLEPRGDEPDEMGSNLPAIVLGAAALELSAGFRFACARLEGGLAKCWGRNHIGYLGQGTRDEIIGGAEGDMSALPAIELSSTETAVQVVGGYVHGCALLTDGSVKCWGNNEYGDLGQNNKAEPPLFETALGDEPGEMGDLLPPVYLGEPAVSLCGGNHTCALLASGALKCWGLNGSGELGLGDTEDRGDEADEMQSLPEVNVSSLSDVTAVYCGKYGNFDHNHTCAVLANGHLKCWGRNSVGQLGLGSYGGAEPGSDDRGDEPGEMGDNLPVVLELW